jgi:hypothetical protein
MTLYATAALRLTDFPFVLDSLVSLNNIGLSRHSK